jgi:hypothetical protein
MIRLKYVSRMAQGLSEEEINQLSEDAARNNATLDITGVLFTSGGLFVQVLEGPEEDVEELYETIASDPRHRDVLLLDMERNVEERLFPGWSMRRLFVDQEARDRLEPLRAMLVSIGKQQEIIDMLKHVLEKALLRELAAVVSQAMPTLD